MLTFKTSLKRLHNIFKPIKLSIDTHHAALIVNKGRKLFYNVDQYSIPIQTIKDVTLRKRFWYSTLIVEQTPSGWLTVKNLEHLDAENIKEVILFLRSVILKQYSASLAPAKKTEVPRPSEVTKTPGRMLEKEVLQRQIPGSIANPEARKLDAIGEGRFYSNLSDQYILMMNNYSYECRFVLKYDRSPNMLLMGISFFTEVGDHLDFHIISNGHVVINWFQNDSKEELMAPARVNPAPGGKDNSLKVTHDNRSIRFFFNNEEVFTSPVPKTVFYKKTLPGIYVHPKVAVNVIEKLSYKINYG